MWGSLRCCVRGESQHHPETAAPSTAQQVGTDRYITAHPLPSPILAEVRSPGSLAVLRRCECGKNKVGKKGSKRKWPRWRKEQQIPILSSTIRGGGGLDSGRPSIAELDSTFRAMLCWGIAEDQAPLSRIRRAASLAGQARCVLPALPGAELSERVEYRYGACIRGGDV